MNEKYVELTLLLGFAYIRKTLKIQIDIQTLLLTPSDFLSNIRKLLRKLLKTTDLQYISNCFQLTPSFLLLISKKAKLAGLCLVCDKLSKNLQGHFKTFHSLGKNYFASYKKSFGPLTESFCPNYKKKKKFLSLKPNVEINKIPKNNYKNSSKTEKRQKTSENTALVSSSKGKRNVSPLFSTLYSMAEQYRDTLLEKDLFRNGVNNKKELEKKGEAVQVVRNENSLENCEVCGAPYKVSDKKRHMKAHQSNEYVKCPICSKDTRQRYLSKHMRRQHK